MVAKTARFKKDAFPRKAFPLVAGLCLVIGALGFIGCDSDDGDEVEVWVDDPELNANIIGEWEHIREGGTSTITVSATEFKYEDVSTYGGIEDTTVSAGTTSAYTSNTEGTAGVIIFRVTEDTYNPDKTGKYTAAYWKELSGTTMRMSTAYKAKGGTGADKNDNAAFFDDLDEAKTQFTLGNNGVWIGTWGGPYTKK